MKRTVFLTLAFMKRSLLVLLPLLGAFSLLTSCGSDDDEPQPEWSFLYGEWMPAGQIYYRTIDGDSVFFTSKAYYPNDIRLIFSPSGIVSINDVTEESELPWENGNYTYEVKKDKEGKHILQFGGKDGHFWYNTEEDALYYKVNDGWLIHYIFKRSIEILPFEKRDNIVELMPMSEMPEWMQKRVSGESAAYEEGATYFDRPRIHQFIYKGKVCYHIYSHMSSILDLGFFYTDTGEGISFGYYDLFWCTTDWKLIYIFPRN